MTKRLAKILTMGVALIMCIGLFAGCGGKGDGKIDIGGTTAAGKPMASVQVRGLMDNDIFSQDDDIKIKIGWGFGNGLSVPSFVEEGAIVVVKIEATGIVIIDESKAEHNNEYEKEFREYSDDKFVCTLDDERYIPNFYETFQLKFGSDSTLGTIQISVTNLMEGTWDGDGDGQTVRLYYAASSDKIAFSTVSMADAQKKIQ